MSSTDASEIFMEAIDAVQPARLIPQFVRLSEHEIIIGDHQFDRRSTGRVIVIGAGKASAAMAQALEKLLLPVIDDGLVITKYGHALPLQKIRCLEAGHPVPDLNGIRGTGLLLAKTDGLKENDLIIFLVSGGASALIADVPPGVPLEAVQKLVRLLLASGANIDEINTIRKHLSMIKGGQLSGRVYPARLVSLILSDVNGDSLSTIASGPTVGDPSTFSDAIEIINKYGLMKSLPVEVKAHLQRGVDGMFPETPKPGDRLLSSTINLLIGTNHISLRAAESAAVAKGFHTVIINSALDGDATLRAKEFVEACLLYSGPRPACLLMGGETTVTVTGAGLGGRNQHFVLAAVCEMIKRGVTIDRMPVILSGGTDGTDGPTDAAGAITESSHLRAGEEAMRYLNENDSYHFFEKYNGLIKTGPTQTNVMDIVIGLCY